MAADDTVFVVPLLKEYAKILGANAVAYLNVDVAVGGNLFLSKHSLKPNFSLFHRDILFRCSCHSLTHSTSLHCNQISESPYHTPDQRRQSRLRLHSSPVSLSLSVCRPSVPTKALPQSTMSGSTTTPTPTRAHLSESAQSSTGCLASQSKSSCYCVLCRVSGLGSGSDYTSFLQGLGITCADMSYNYFVSLFSPLSSLLFLCLIIFLPFFIPCSLCSPINFL